MTRATATIDFSTNAMRQWRDLPEGTLAEVINGKLYILASSSPYHAEISLRIVVELEMHIRMFDVGKVYHSPVDVHLFNGRVVIPDIVFVANKNKLITNETGLHGVPDLHIEILSPNNKRRDLVTKKDLYEQAGVREYWIVDPITKDSWGYFLEDGKYGEPLTMNSKIHLRTLNKQISF